MTWTSRQGLTLPDLVGAAQRRAWAADGHYLDVDLYRMFRQRVQAHPDRPAVIDPRATVSYAQLDVAARRFAGVLRAAGVCDREIVAIRLPNGWPAVAAELAVALLGAVALTFPDGPGSGEARSLLARSRATALVTDRDFADTELPHVKAVLTTEQLQAGTDLAVPAPAADPDAPARILVSSGSESEPKMIAYSHNAMGGGRGNYLRAIYAGRPDPRALILVPLSASYGSLGTVSVQRHGATLVLLDRFDPAAALAAIAEHRITHLFGVATILRRMTSQSAEPDEDLSSLDAVIASCDGLPTPVLAAALDRFGCPISNLYGSSDGVNCRGEYDAPGVETTALSHPDLAVCDFEVRDEQGRALPAGTPGELWARGPMTPLCYVGAPDLDAGRRDPAGWVRSGDHGLLDSERRLHLLRRNSAVIKRGGFTISPAEVERHAGAHPALAEAVCVPVPDEDLGERLCVCVVARPGAPAPSLAELNLFLVEQRGLERRKLPEQLVSLAALPLGSTGKLSRVELSRLAAART
ncbi:class I adenylate-forming enzyme family protein [Kitasatospora viridis]|uniref:Acyl-CoA synthetase (AMP-forming)/AMP-acid ligase II n=1 Tax=Kitasatospora viridis TaxID=281105 RepID=A0A561SF18_9ACTN|nr:class I adenylate-forming enzyme family protein [Kitasatospora viridis]TWF73461.1 acyl-CoA synthetase (AMP-forming)/AMP-acid ligase II [Kitasatospora viridis]